ncbi:MAG: 7TM diverse intracellular signaling domain-containing protein [Bacteroidota bacterium]
MKFVALLLKYLPVLTVFLASLPGVAGAQPVPIDISRIILTDTIDARCWFFVGNLHAEPPASIATLPFQAQRPGNIFKTVNPRQVEKDWYINFCLENTADSAISVYFYPGIYFKRIDLFRYNESTKKVDPLPRVLPDFPDSIGYRTITMAAHTKNNFYVRLGFVKTDINNMDIRIIRDYYLPVFAKNFKLSDTNNKMYYYIITGILLMMIFYSMAVFILNGSFEFMYYACFAFFMGLLFFLKSYYYKTPAYFNYFFESYLDFVILCLGFFFYFIFLRKFLETRKNFPFLNKLFSLGQIIILASIFLFSYFNFFDDRFVVQNTIEIVTKYQWFATTVVFIIYAIVHNNKMLNYLAVGHSFLLAASLLSQLLIQSPNKLNIPASIWRDALFCFQLGITIELVFFLMALAFKNRRDIIERTRERERLWLDNERKEFEKQLAVVEAKQEERNRISTDMHDELGSGVTAIRLMSEIVKTKMKGNTLPEIDKISNNANELLSKMNTIIWTMSSSNDRLDNMIAYTRSYAFEFLENTSINCHFETDEFIPPTEISGEKRRNIFLCVKESLNNIAKHSRACDVWIKVNIRPDSLEIEIHDNGIGINFQKLREFGNGLNNMKKRIESIDGSFLIVNKDGTTTTFTVPM